jgi:hypothetical protein
MVLQEEERSEFSHSLQELVDAKDSRECGKGRLVKWIVGMSSLKLSGSPNSQRFIPQGIY